MPNDNVIDNLSIQVKTEAQTASTVIDGLATRLTNLSNVLKGFTKKKINIGVNSEQVEILRQFANAIEDLNFTKLNAFANLTQQIKKINIGLKPEDGTNMSMFSMGLEDLNIDKFRQYAEVSKDVAKISLGIGDKSGAGFSTFVDSLNRADTGKMQAFADAFRDFGGVHIGFQQAGVESLAGFVVAMNSADMDKMTQFADAFREFGGVHIGITEKGADAFKAFADASSSLSETALEKLRSLSSIDFSNLKPLADAAQGMKALTNATEANAPATEKAEKAQKKLATATRSVRHATHRAHHTFNLANTALGKLFNSIKRIAFYRLIRSAIKAVTQGFGEGIENLYRWSQAWGTSFAPAMDQLKTAQTYLKNGFASMFSPLIEYAIPIIDRVVDRLVDMFNAVQELFAQLTGAATWNKAIKYPVKYKDDLDNAAKSAKALQNILMDFDEINAINTPNEGSRGSGKEQEDYSKMFELVKTSTKSDSALSKFIESFNGLSFDPIKNSLKNLWNEGIKPIADYFSENGGKFLSPLVQFFVEEGLPTAINLVTAALKPFLDIVQPLLDSGFFDDIAGKLSAVNNTVQKFADFFGKLNFKPIGDALAEFWSILSPIIDRMIAIGDWVQEHILQPIIQFVVEKGLPAAISAIGEALRSVWSAIEPVISGLQSFWNENGEWIMEMVEGQILTGIQKIKESFQIIGQFFQKNGTKIKGIFENISKIIRPFAPLIKKIAEMIGTSAWESFINTIRNLFDTLQPVLDLLSGLFDILAVFITGDANQFKRGLESIGTSILDGIFFPFKVVLRVLATVLDALGSLSPACKEAAHKIRVFIGDEIEEVDEKTKEATRSTTKYYKEVDEAGNYVSKTGAKISAAQDEINQKRAEEIRKVQELGVTNSTMAREMTEWYNYCSEQGLDPMTGKIIFAAQEMEELAGETKYVGTAAYDAKTAIDKINPQSINNVGDAVAYANRVLTEMPEEAREAFVKTSEWGSYCRKWGINPVSGALLDVARDMNGLPVAAVRDSKVFVSAWQTSLNGLVAAAAGAGGQIGKNLLNNAQAALNMSPLQIKATVTANVNGVNVNDKWRAALAAAGVPISGFASGGFPSPSSLFYAGEGGVPELMGTVGGRTAVAGGEEITGIRSAIEDLRASDAGLLRQLISAVANKDLTLVANSKTGRWVNQSLKAYAGVTG